MTLITYDVGLSLQIWIPLEWFVFMHSVTDSLLMWAQDNDMAARKDAVMQNIRQELALANAQELMNVWTVNTLTSVEQFVDPLQTLESHGAVFFEMRDKTWEFIGERRTGEDTIWNARNSHC